jgi:hypothetical protein
MKLRCCLLFFLVAFFSNCGNPADQAEEYYNMGKYDMAFKTANQAYSKDKTNSKAAMILWKSQIAARNCGSAQIVESAYNAIRGSVTERDASILSPLQEALGDKKGCIRLFAIYALGDLPFDGAAEQLVDILHGNLPDEVEPGTIKNELLIGEAALILGKRVYTPAYEDLIKMTSSEKGLWRAKAAESLGYMSDERAVERLKELLKDEYTVSDRRIVAEAASLSLKLLTGEDHVITP